MPDYLKLYRRGIVLDDGNILFLGTCNLRKTQCLTVNDYNNITLYDTKLNKIVSEYHSDNDFAVYHSYDYFKLDNEKLCIISQPLNLNNANTYIAIYNIQDNSLYKTNIKGDIILPKGVKISEQEILIFSEPRCSEQKTPEKITTICNSPHILKYNTTDNSIKVLKSKTSLQSPSYTKINDKIIILGFNPSPKDKYNEIYDINNDKIVRIPNMQENHVTPFLNGIYKPLFKALPLGNEYVIITGGEKALSFTSPTGIAQDVVEVYSISNNKFKSIGKSHYAHKSHSMLKLDNGDILLIGGFSYKLGFKNFQLGSSKISKFEIFKTKIKERNK